MITQLFVAVIIQSYSQTQVAAGSIALCCYFVIVPKCNAWNLQASSFPFISPSRVPIGPRSYCYCISRVTTQYCRVPPVVPCWGIVVGFSYYLFPRCDHVGRASLRALIVMIRQLTLVGRASFRGAAAVSGCVSNGRNYVGRTREVAECLGACTSVGMK